jgi:restriction endonuclease Mrr
MNRFWAYFTVQKTRASTVPPCFGFFGSLDRHKATKGLFVTTSTFSASAKETAEHLSKRIVLVDGDQLARLMIRHNVGWEGAQSETRRRLAHQARLGKRDASAPSTV